MKKFIQLMALALALAAGPGAFAQLSEGFEGASMGTWPTGWTASATDPDGAEWIVASNQDLVELSEMLPVATAHGGNNVAFAYTNYGEIAFLTSPTMDMSQTTGNTLTFWYCNVDVWTYHGTLTVKYSSDGGTNWTTAMTQGATQTAWTLATVTLPETALTSTFKLRFEFSTGVDDFGYLLLDDLLMGDGPDCTSPTGLRLAAADREALDYTFAWNSGIGATGYNVLVSTTPVTDLDNAAYTTVTDTFYTPSGLSLDEDYHFYVQSDCGGEWLHMEFTTSPLLTVCDGSMTNQYLPVYGYYADDFLRGQMLYPGSLLTPLRGQAIMNMRFYTSSPSAAQLTSRFEVRLSVVNDNDLSNGFLASGEVVYTDTLNTTGAFMDIPIPDGFVYPLAGGNLLLEIASVTDGNYSSVSWYGQSMAGMGVSGFSSMSVATVEPTQRNFLPKVTFTYGEPPSCLTPSRVSAVSVTDNEMTVSWFPGADEGQWNVIVSDTVVTDFSEWTPEVAYDTFLTVQNLLAQTDYHVYVQADCGGEQSSWAHGVVRTQCGVITQVPWTFDFESVPAYGTQDNLLTPECWQKVSAAGSEPNANPCPYRGGSEGMNHSGTTSLSMWMNGTSTLPGMGNLIALPPFENLNTLAISFWAYQESANPCDVFVVGVMEGTQFVPVDTVQLGYDTYSQYTVSFGDYEGDGNQPALRAMRLFGQMHVYLDDITMDLIPDCMAPSNLRATYQSATTATLAWNGDADGAYQVYYSATEADEEDLYAMETVYGDLSLSIYGLTANTTYHAYVRTDCGGEASEWLHTTFTTARCDGGCEVKLVMHDSYGDGWNGNAISVSANGQPIASATISAYTNYGTASVGACPDDTLRFAWVQGNFAYETSFEILDAWDNELYACNSGSGLTDGETFFTWLADCAAPTCPTPRGLRVGETDSVSAWVYWMDTVNSAWEVEYGLPGFVLGQGTTVTSTDDSVQLTNLSASVTYQFYVKALCDDTTVVSEPMSFTTGCGVIAMFPYSTGFEGIADQGMPTCWQQLQSCNGVNPCVNVASAYAHTGSGLLSLWAGNGNANLMAMPQFNNLEGLRLTFWARQTAMPTVFSVGVMDEAEMEYRPMDTISNLPANYNEYTIDLTPYADYGHQVAFYNLAGVVHIDDVTVELVPDCTPVASVAADESLSSTTSLTFNWVDTENQTWEYIYDNVPVLNDVAYTPTPSATPSVTLSGLQAGTTYYFYVRPACEGNAPWTSCTGTTLLCDDGCDVEIVMHDQFTDGWGGYAGSSAITVTQNGIAVGYASLATGSYGTESIHVCPNVPVSFSWARGTYPGECSFEIEDAWGNELYACASGSGILEGATFFTYTTNCAQPTCVAPRLVRADNVASTTADIVWFDTMANSWTVVYADHYFITDTAATGAGLVTLTSSDTTLALTGLTAQTTYTLYVRANCTDTTIWSAPITFRTGCTEVTSVPWTEGFEGMATDGNNGQFDECWSVLHNYSSNPCPYGGNAHTGSVSVSVYAYRSSYGTYDNLFVLPAFGDLSGLEFSFYGYQETTNPAELFSVGVIDATGEYVPMDTLVLPYDSYGLVTVYLDAYAALGNRVAIYGRSTGTQDMHVYLDDFTIDSVSGCPAVTQLTASDMTTSSATLDWTDNGQSAPMEYLVEYGPMGFTPGQGTTLTTTTHPVTLNGLGSSSSYQFYVRAVCAAGDSAQWSGPALFNTECETAVIDAANPFFESFESPTAPANCWTIVNGGGTINTPIHTGDQHADGNRSFRFSSYSSASNYNQYLVSPQLQSAGDMVLAFRYKKYSASYPDQLEWGYSETSADPTDSTWVWSGWLSDISGNWQEALDTLPATAQYVGFHYYGNYQYYVYLDSVSITSSVAGCNRPGNLSASNIDYQGATIAWSGAGSEYGFSYKAQNDATFGAEQAVSGTTYTLSGLTPATEYLVRVRQNCQADELGWSDYAYLTFTTDSLPCFAPENLSADAQGTTATLTWSAANDGATFQVRYAAQGDTLTAEAATTSVELTGLLANTTYTAWVRALCGGGAAESDWSEPASFTTRECEPVSDITVTEITATGATVSWTSNGPATAWKLNIGEAGHNYANGREVDVTGTPTVAITGLEPGTAYDVIIRAICGEGWVSTDERSSTFHTQEGSGQGIDQADASAISLYPNPATTEVTIEGYEGEAVIVDMTGRVVMRQEITPLTSHLSLLNLPSGAYFVKLGTEVKKLIVK